MLEKKTGIINIQGHSKETISAILDYIYTGKCPKLPELAASILPAAEEFLLSELKIMCMMELSRNLSLKNVFEVLKLADLFSEPLKKQCLDLITKNSKIIILDQFRGLNQTHPELFLEIFSKVSAILN